MSTNACEGSDPGKRNKQRVALGVLTFEIERKKK